MPLPALTNWDRTRTGLQQAAQIIGAIRAALVPPEPNYVHLGLRVIPEGLTTGSLPPVGEFILDFHTLAILYNPPDREPLGFALAQRSQTTLAEAITGALADLDHMLAIPREKLTGTTVFDIDPSAAADYAQVLNLLAETFERFRASLPGAKTPAIVWPHGFDLSFLWFATELASEQAPHMNFGFSPYSAGIERPYIYTYPYPLPDGITAVELPPLTHWHTQGWTGTVTSYDNLVNVDDPAAVIEDTLQKIYATVAPLL